MRTLARLASVAFLSAALSVAACSNTGNDPGDRVDKALKDANVKNVNVDYDKDGRVVHLKGKVNTSYDRDRADQIANSIVGTSGKVVNELTVEGMDADTADNLDDQIETRLNDAVKTDAALTDRDIDFHVNNGVVTITGEVNSAAEKTRVFQMAKGVTGVKDVANELTIKNQKKDNGRPRGTTGR
jgi:osmotically-inducible protein OsmY